MLKRLSSFVIRFRWAVAVFWILILAVVLLFSPKLSDVVKSNQESFLPSDSEAIKASDMMNKLFPDKGGKTTLVLAFERKEGLNDKDREYAGKLEDFLKKYKSEYKIYEITSPFTKKESEGFLLSKDKKAAIIYVSLNVGGYTEDSEKIISSIRNDLKGDKKLHEHIDAPQIPSGLGVHMTGDAVIAQEEHETVNKSMAVTGIITVILVALVLIIIYRSPIAFFVPLFTIGLSFLISRGIVATLANMGLKVSTFTETFLIAVLFGAGTDYCLLVISRFREELASGKSVPEALKYTMPKTGEAIISSGGTVIIGFSCMYFARFGLYKTTGPSVAIGVAVTLLSVLTLIPAILAMFGEKIFWPFHPSRSHKAKQESRIWAKISRIVTTHPVQFIIICIVVFTPFIISAKLITRSFDQLGDMPSYNESVQGFRVIKDHMDQGLMLPVNIVMKTNKNLWDNNSLQVVDDIANNIMKLDNVAKVMTATRPGGDRIDEATFPKQMSMISDGLKNADLGKLEEMQNGMKDIADGMASKSDDFNKMIDGTGEAVAGISHVNDGLGELASGTDSAVSGLNKVNGGLDNLNTRIGSSNDGLYKVNEALKNVQKVLEGIMASQPALSQDSNFQLAYGTVKGLIPNIDKISSGLTVTQDGMSSAKTGVTGVSDGLGKIKMGINQSVSALSQIQVGLEKIKDGQIQASEQLAKVSEELKTALADFDSNSSSTSQMKSGLDEAVKMVDEYNNRENKLDAPFFLPQSVLDLGKDRNKGTGEEDDQINKLLEGMKEYISPDGNGITFKVILSTPPYTKESLDKIPEIKRIVTDTLRKSYLDGAEVYMGGPTAIFSEVRDITAGDFVKVILFVLLGIFIVLCILLRSFVAPVYLLLTILISYGTTMGISYYVFQVLLGYDGLSWSTTFFAFCLLVALGVDYNIFLMSRVKEEYRPGDVVGGVSRALTTTGGIITSCGIIMAGTFGALLASPIRSLFEVGFAAVVGLLIDTFIVRSLLVPALAVKIGELNWWPGRKVKIISASDERQS